VKYDQVLYFVFFITLNQSIGCWIFLYRALNIN